MSPFLHYSRNVASTMNDKPKSPQSWKFRLFVGLCIVAVVLLTVLIFLAPKLIKDAKLRAFMADVKAGERTTVFGPDPGLLEDSLQDREFASAVRKVVITSHRTIDDHRFSCLKRFPNLQVIWIEYAGDADAFLEHIQGMASLEELGFHHAQFSATGAKLLRSFPRLKRLQLDRATDATLGQIEELPQLEALNIAYGHVSDAGLEHLKHLTQLKRLDLWYTGFTQQGIASFQQALPKCKVTVNEAGGEDKEKGQAKDTR
jgi:hypothetical protein